MNKKKFNIKGLGLKQLDLLYKMAKENLVVRVRCDHFEREIILEDEQADNSYEKVSHSIMKSLGKRRVFKYSGWMPALFVTIDTYSLKKEVAEALGLMPNEQKDKRSVATKMPKEPNDDNKTKRQ